MPRINLQDHAAGWIAALDGTRLPPEPAATSPDVARGAGCTVVFDGVLYNQAALIGRLGGRGRLEEGDASLLLQAYLRWGEGLTEHIKGIFALIVHDERTDVLLAVRDPLGAYPLFHADPGDGPLFSTSIEALARHPRVEAGIDRTTVAEYLCYRMQEPEQTFFEGIRRVPPGNVLKYAGGRRYQYRYWDPAPDHGDVDWVTDDELERFDELLDQAVERCLSQGRSGIFLSGGLDSVSIAAVAADNTRRHGMPDPLALSLVFPDPEANEEAVQRGVAAGLGLPHELVPFDEAAGPQGLLSSGMAMSSAAPVPLHNPWAPAYDYLARRGGERGCSIIMSGGGGDEWLTVSPYYAADLLRSMDVKGLYDLWSSAQRSLKLSRLALVRSFVWTFGARPWAAVAAREALRKVAPGLLRDHWRRRVDQGTPSWMAPDRELRVDLDRRMERSLWERPVPHSFYLDEGRLSLEHPLVSMEMEEDFLSWRNTGVRQLMPYWDADLIDFLYRTPPELLNRGERSKALVRRTVARRFPSLRFERQKKVLATNFFSSKIMEEGTHLWRTWGGAQALTELGVVDGKALDATMPTLLSGTQSTGETHRIRDVLFLEAWLRPRLGIPTPLTNEPGQVSLVGSG